MHPFLADGGIADAYGGQIAAMDVYLLQALMGREGLLNAIDVAIEPDASIETVLHEVQRSVAGIARASVAGSSIIALIFAIRRLIASINPMISIGRCVPARKFPVEIPSVVPGLTNSV